MADAGLTATDEVAQGENMIDITRCRNAMENIYVHGQPGTKERLELIEDAITGIQKDGSEAMKKRYHGIKNYASFGDQEAGCQYGMGPAHGSIVFSIGRVNTGGSTGSNAVLGADEIYILECVRDFGVPKMGSRRVNGRDRNVADNLIDVIEELDEAQLRVDKARSFLEGAKVEAHV